PLTVAEFDLLRVLLQRPGRVLARDLPPRPYARQACGFVRPRSRCSSVASATSSLKAVEPIQDTTWYRLWGIDAPEGAQTCPDGWPVGSLATTRLKALTLGHLRRSRAGPLRAHHCTLHGQR